MDVTDAESVKNAAKQLKDVAIDVLINSAGIAGVPGQKTGNVDYDSWAQVLNVNTMGPLRVLESFSDHITESERRLVVTITSGMGSLTENTSGGSIAYRTTTSNSCSWVVCRRSGDGPIELACLGNGPGRRTPAPQEVGARRGPTAEAHEPMAS